MLAYFLEMLEGEKDKRAFTTLYKENHIRMEQAAMRILKDQADAEDAMQNAFLQIIRHFEEIYKIPCDKLPSWCVSIVKNEALSILRKKKRLVFLDDLPNNRGRSCYKLCRSCAAVRKTSGYISRGIGNETPFRIFRKGNRTTHGDFTFCSGDPDLSWESASSRNHWKGGL